jgi:hypothetical protein
MAEGASETLVPQAAEWFLAIKGEKLGPVCREEMEELARLDGLDPRHDMVWKEGMDKWVPAGEIEGLFERRAPDEVEETPGMAATAATAEAAALGEEESGVWDDEEDDPYFHHEITEPWPGTGRLGYFLAVAVLPLAGNFLLVFVQNLASGVVGPQIAQWIPLLSIGFAIIALYATIMRFPNLGMSRWWFFGMFVPILNWWLGYRLFACPPGYAYTRKLDAIGWVLAILYWLSIILGLVAVVALLAMVAKGGFDLEAFLRALENG